MAQILLMLFAFVGYSAVQHVLTIRVTWRASYKRQELLTFREHPSSPLVFWWGPCCSFFSFLSCPIMCLYILSSVLWCFIQFLHNNLQLFVGGLMAYLCCVCLHIVVSNTYCVMFLLCLVYPMLLVSLDCHFLIAPAVFSNIYLNLRRESEGCIHSFE